MGRTAHAALVAITLLAGCDSPPPVMPAPDAGQVFGIVSSAQIVAWEGQPRFVTVLTSQTGESLEGATVAVVDPDGPLSIVDERCAGTQCAVVLSILDRVANSGAAIPPPIDAHDAYLAVRREGDPERRSLLRVMPLDTITGSSGELQTGGVRFASSAEMSTGTFAGRPDGEPIRWIVFGDAHFAGTIDVSADGASAGPGGYDGGSAASAGEGPGGGGAGSATDGGGGGGFGSAGAAGQGGAGGSAGAANGDPGCALDFFASAPCGGSGGGGASGTGGGGGGALAVVVLGQLDLGGATLRSTGGAGASGGGGGAGGVIAIAGSGWSAPALVDVSGGAGEGSGGEGGDGFVIAAGGPAPEGARVGPAVDLASTPAITDQSTLTLHGAAAPGAAITVESLDGARFEGAADASGAFSVDVTLSAGLNRLRVSADDGSGAVRSWVGTSIELERRDSATLPVGALVDIARVP